VKRHGEGVHIISGFSVERWYLFHLCFFLFATEASLFILIMNVSLFSAIVILSECSSNVVILAPYHYPV